eukprot:9620867-Ditylum_brightwellii.AAC.1
MIAGFDIKKLKLEMYLIGMERILAAEAWSPGGQGKNNGRGVTVYEEMEGQDAIDTVLSMLPKDVIDVTGCKINTQYNSFDITHLPEK